jgi:hypothetical protein
MPLESSIHKTLQRGVVIPAHPLALNARRKFDERRQRALSRYYIAAEAGGLAVGVHTTQFAIRQAGLYRPVLALAAEEMDRSDAERETKLVRVAGVCGDTRQAVAEAATARDLGYHAGLLNLGAMARADDRKLIAHCRAVSRVIPLFGFYLQPAVGGRPLGHRFWRAFAQIDGVVAIKIACFNRYQTIDVVRAVAESGRDDIALYTGNDDDIVMDLIRPFVFNVAGRRVERRIVGGLLGHWAVWTQKAAALLRACHEAAESGLRIPRDLLPIAVQTTDANAAIFDAANGFAGCVPGIHYVLWKQGLLSGTWCLDKAQKLGAGQAAEIDRVCNAYPHLTDDWFVAEHRDEWLR